MSERQYREAEMSPAVCEWLRSIGYSPYAEVPMWGSASHIDHVGVRWSDESVICVEMKCSFSRKAMYQAHLRQLATPLVYIATPTAPRKASLEHAEKYGYGVISAGRVILEPCQKCKTYDNYRQCILDFCRHAQEGGIGGMPTIAGEGPAIRVAAAVDEYLKQHPGANWKQVFADVPNHYATARSMAGALPFARVRAQRAQHNRDLLAMCNGGTP